MEKVSYKNPKAFSSRKISTEQAVKILKRNGVQVTDEQAILILDFLYLIAKTTPHPATFADGASKPQEEVEHQGG